VVSAAPTETPAPSAEGVDLIVGVTGHRDLIPADEPELRRAVSALLGEIAGSAPHSRLTVLAVLRRGSGLLAAEAALDAGFRLIACIAAPAESCERDLAEADAIRFRAVIARCEHVAVVPPGAADPGGESALAWYLAFHSHIVIALWDGAASRAPGATAGVVRLRETGLASLRGRDGEAPRHQPDPMPVFQIVAPRAGGERPAGALSVRRRYPRRFSGDRQARASFEAAIAHLDRYNRDLGATGGAGPGLPALMDRTDRTANRLQRRVLYQLRTFYGVSFLAIAAQLGFGAVFTPEPVKVATLAAVFVVYRILRSGDLENRYQDYRAVAEGLRVQIAWNAAGATDEYVDPYYMRMQQSELQWIRMALRSAAFTEAFTPGARDARVARAWVRQQWRYYHRAAARDLRNAGRYDRFAQASQVIGALTMIVALLSLLPALREVGAVSVLSAKHAATGFAALVGAAVALVGSFAEKRGYLANAKRYDRMFAVFERALRQLHRASRSAPDDEIRIVREVGREALVEQAEWLLAHRDHPLRVVAR
jgi:hypothetical protein